MKRLIAALLAALLISGLLGCQLPTSDKAENSFEKIVQDFEQSFDALPHYYSQLSDIERAAYASIVATINAGGTTASLPKIDQTSLEAATRAVSYDNPQFVYLSKTWIITHYISGATIDIPYQFSAEKRNAMENELEAKVKEILSGISPDMSDYEKELYLHDYLVKKCEYDDSPVSENEVSNVHTAYGALVDGRAVCEGYAMAMKLLLSRVGIESRVIPGTTLRPGSGEVGHMWNVVKIGSKWYHLDATWDDPMGTSGADVVWHSYFNLTDEEIRRDHTFDEPTSCTDIRANFYRKNLLHFTSYDSDEIADKLADELYKAKRTNKNFVEIRFANQDDYDAAKQEFGRSVIQTAVRRANNKYNTKISTSLIYFSTVDAQLVIGIKF